MRYRLGGVGAFAGALGLAGVAHTFVVPGSAVFAGSAVAAAALAQTSDNPSVTGPVQGEALVQALRQGGLILWMRHGARDKRSGDVSDQQAASHNCSSQSQLTPEGEAQARAVGAGMRALRLPIAAVYVARLCRTEATGRLLNVAPVVEDRRLDKATTWTDRGGGAAYQKAVLAILGTPPPPGKDVVDVTSQLTTRDPQPRVLAGLGAAEVAVFKPDPGGGPQLLARIRPDGWPMLARLADRGQH